MRTALATLIALVAAVPIGEVFIDIKFTGVCEVDAIPGGWKVRQMILPCS
jgi:hypothetical protein